MSIKNYEVTLTVTDTETGDSISRKTDSDLIAESKRYFNVNWFDEMFSFLCEEIRRQQHIKSLEIENNRILSENPLQECLESFVGQENTIETQEEIAKAILANLPSKYKITCDETNNNEQTAKENRIVCDVEFYE